MCKYLATSTATRRQPARIATLAHPATVGIGISTIRIAAIDIDQNAQNLAIQVRDLTWRNLLPAAIPGCDIQIAIAAKLQIASIVVAPIALDIAQDHFFRGGRNDIIRRQHKARNPIDGIVGRGITELAAFVTQLIVGVEEVDIIVGGKVWVDGDPQQTALYIATDDGREVKRGCRQQIAILNNAQLTTLLCNQ